MSQQVKPYKSIDEQIKILEERGLIIDDGVQAKKILMILNYYRISAYTLTLRKDDHFYKNVHFSDIMQIYYFDMELRALLMYLLESVEVSMRTFIGHYHAKHYGPLGYLNKDNFENEERYFEFDSNYRDSIKEYGEKEIFVKHHNDVYDGQFPIWVLVELLTFGSLSRLFKNLPKYIRDEICADNYGLIKESYIVNWLQGMTILRNICAHRGRLYNRYITFGLKLSNKDKKLFSVNGVGGNKKQFFLYLFVLKKMIVDESVWKTFTEKFVALLSKYPFVRLRYYGFPEDWKELLGILEEKSE